MSKGTKSYVAPFDKKEHAVRRQLDSLRAIHQRVARIHSGRKVTTELVSQIWLPHGFEDVPGWTDGIKVSYNELYLAEDYKKAKAQMRHDPLAMAKFVARFKGLSYHELSHILYSPRNDHLLIQAIKHSQQAERMWFAYNALEDQRIEHYFTTKYKATIPYFTQICADWIINEKQALPTSWALLYGRKYLPDHLRKVSRDVFDGSVRGHAVIQRLEDVIDRYLDSVVYSANDTEWRMPYSLIEEYMVLLTAMSQQFPNSSPTMDNLPTSHPSGVLIQREGKPSEEEQKQAQAQAKKGKGQSVSKNKKAKDDENESPANDEGEDSASNGTGQSKDTPDENPSDGDDDDGEGEGSGDDSEGGSDSEGDSDDSENEAGGKAAGTGSGPQSSPNDLLDAARDVLVEIHESAEVQSDISNTLDRMHKMAQDSDGLEGSSLGYMEQPPSATAKRTVNRIIQRMDPIKLDLDREKVRGQVTGRVNARKILARPAWDTRVFDKSEDFENEAGGFAACILLDVSGSMTTQMGLVSQMMWVIKRAFDQLDIETTVLAFESTWHTLYRPRERADVSQVRSYGSLGGTQPLTALQQAHRLLTKSQRENRVLVTITDGEWEIDEQECARILGSLHAQNTTTMLLGIGGGRYGGGVVNNYGLHSHQIGRDTNSIEELPIAISALVAKVMREVVKNLRTT